MNRVSDYLPNCTPCCVNRLRRLSDDELILNLRGGTNPREVVTNGLACRTESRTTE